MLYFTFDGNVTVKGGGEGRGEAVWKRETLMKGGPLGDGKIVRLGWVGWSVGLGTHVQTKSDKLVLCKYLYLFLLFCCCAGTVCGRTARLKTICANRIGLIECSG